jgi:hypothetical protein
MRLLPKFWQRHFLMVEAAIALLCSTAFAVWFLRYDGASVTSCILQGNRAPFYGAMSSIFGSLLGFVITATSVVLGFSTSDRLAVVRESSEYPKLWKTFSSTIWSLALSTMIALACLLFDKDTAPTDWLLIPLFFSVLLSLLRIARTIWCLEQIISLVTKK